MKKRKWSLTFTRLSSTLSPSTLPSPALTNLRRTTSLIYRLAGSGDLAAAHRLLLSLPSTDACAWNSLISVSAKSGKTADAFRIFDEMPHRPDEFTLSCLLKAASFISGIDLSQMIHGQSFKLGLIQYPFVVAGLLDNYAKAGELCLSEKLFRESCSLDQVSWSVMISGYARHGEWESAVKMFVKMRDFSLLVNDFCFASVFAVLADEGYGLDLGKMLHCLSLKMGLLFGGSGITLSNALLHMYCKCGDKDDGHQIFGEIQEPDVISWSTYLEILDGPEALNLFRFLQKNEMEINEYTVINVISTIGNTSLLLAGKQIQAWCYKLGFVLFISVANALISMYGRCFQIHDANRMFNMMICRDCVSWNAMISAFAENCIPSSALKLFSQMRNLSLRPNVATLTSILYAVSKEPRQIHSHIIKAGYMSSDSLITTLITIYGKCAEVEESKRVFQNIEVKCRPHVDAMMAILVQNYYYYDAVELFCVYHNRGMEIQSSSLCIVLKACCYMWTVEQGTNFHSLALKSGMDRDHFFGSAIISLYSKCGMMSSATRAFEKLPKDHLASWNAMITGYAHNGCCEKAIELFKELYAYDIQPDGVTFLGVLYACCHGGYVKEAYYYLNSMLEEHDIAPCLEHYACVVDLLGRVGNLDEAKSVIDRMPFDPDAKMWQIFLTACNIHGHLELGKLAAEKLLKFEPDNDSAHVVLSHLYATKGMWDEVREIRKGMKERTIFKEPGYSWIEMRGGISSLFYANDMSHPRDQEIRCMMEVLTEQILELDDDGNADLEEPEIS